MKGSASPTHAKKRSHQQQQLYRARVVRWGVVFSVLVLLFLSIFSFLYWSDIRFYWENGKSSSYTQVDDFTRSSMEQQQKQAENKFMATMELDKIEEEARKKEEMEKEKKKQKKYLRQNPVEAAAVQKITPVANTLVQAASKPPIDPSKNYFVRFQISLEGNSSAPANNVALVFEIVPEWAPLGTKRFLDLVQASYYNDCRFFRVIKVLSKPILFLHLINTGVPNFAEICCPIWNCRQP
jgi:hypothetical protein